LNRENIFQKASSLRKNKIEIQVMTISTQISSLRQQQLTEAVRQYSRKLFAFVRKKVATDQDAEDLVQDTFQQLIITSLNEPIEQVSAWLYRVAGNKVIDWYRKKKPVPLENFAVKSDESDEAILPEFLFADTARIPDELLNRKIFWDMLNDALDELPAEQSEVFRMHELDGLSFEQMQEKTKANLNTLLSRKRYAVLHLRKKLTHFYHEFFND